MQTFLPYPSFQKSAKVLDNRRLGKQRVEAKQILEINLKVYCRENFECIEYIEDLSLLKICENYDGGKIPWENHPAVRMWRGYEPVLSHYGSVMCREWISRGFKDNLLSFFNNYCEAELRKFQPNINYIPEPEDISNFAYNNFEIFFQYPEWMCNQQVMYDFCYSHRANLMRKDPVFYGKYNWEFFGDYTKEPYKWNKEFWR